MWKMFNQMNQCFWLIYVMACGLKFMFSRSWNSKNYTWEKLSNSFLCVVLQTYYLLIVLMGSWPGKFKPVVCGKNVGFKQDKQIQHMIHQDMVGFFKFILHIKWSLETLTYFSCYFSLRSFFRCWKMCNRSSS